MMKKELILIMTFNERATGKPITVEMPEAEFDAPLSVVVTPLVPTKCIKP
jgi:hypothetical protein